MTYAEKLRDPRWQRKRLEIFERDKFSCRFCADTESPLHVHHRRYDRLKDPWDYPNDNFLTLCETCHSGVTSLIAAIRLQIVDDLSYSAFVAANDAITDFGPVAVFKAVRKILK